MTVLRRSNPVSITDAPENPEAEFRRRRLRYVAMMLLRIVCLVLAAVLFSVDVPYAQCWAALCIVGMVGLPWAAVLIANDRAPLRRSERSSVVATEKKSLDSVQRPLL